MCFINHFFYEAHFLFLVMFMHINSTYIKLDTPYFYKVQIKISVHGWPAAAAALMIVRCLFHRSATECTASPEVSRWCQHRSRCHRPRASAFVIGVGTNQDM